MSGAPITPPRTQFSDAQGVPLAGGYVYTYLAGTSTLTNTWTDFAQTSLNTNPIQLSAAGHCTIFGDTSKRYKLVVTDALGVEQTHLGGDNAMPSGVSQLTQSFNWTGGAYTITVGTVTTILAAFVDNLFMESTNFTVVGQVITPTFTQSGIRRITFLFI